MTTGRAPERAAGRAPAPRAFLARWWLTLAIVLAVASVFALAVWSAALEREAALEDFTHEQESLASAVAIDFEHRLGERAEAPDGGSAEVVDDVVHELLAGASRLEKPGELMVLVSRPGEPGFLTTDHRVIPSSRLRAGLDARASHVVVPREEASGYGLPRRLAIAGLAHVDEHGRRWGVVVLTTAERLRIRQRHEEWRLALTALVVTALVAALGRYARHRQRVELDLERRVAVTSLEGAREAALAKADKMATVAALSTGVAHELGTPLSVILGRVEQVRARVGEEPRANQALGIIEEQVERIRRIVRGLLALARGETPHLVATPPAELASRAADLVKHRYSLANVRLTCDVDEGLPTIPCEPALFEQALVNVLLNACEATPRDGVVRLHVARGEGQVLFVVDDEGEGIPDAIAEGAGKPFFSTKREEGGSGLGLTIAREIVTHHAGALTVARREGGLGTRATISVVTT